MPRIREPAWDVVVVGGGLTDFVVRGEQLPSGECSLQGDVFFGDPGGKGLNQAVAAARLGARVAWIGKVGQDERGDRILDALAEEGVDTRHALRDESLKTGAALISVDAQGRVQSHAWLGASSALRVEDIRHAAGTLSRARVVLAQLEVPLDAAFEALKVGAATGARTVLDPAPPRPLPMDRLFVVDVIRLNASEGQALTGIEVKDHGSARLAAEKLIWQGAEAVVIGAGEDENLLLHGEFELRLPRYPLTAVDRSGAGDAFAAAIAVAIAEGRSLPDAATFGNAAAALATTVLGAFRGLPRRAQVDALLRGDGIVFNRGAA
jgi:ribokinase